MLVALCWRYCKHHASCGCLLLLLFFAASYCWFCSACDSKLSCCDQSQIYSWSSIISTTNFQDLPSTRSKRQRHPWRAFGVMLVAFQTFGDTWTPKKYSITERNNRTTWQTLLQAANRICQQHLLNLSKAYYPVLFWLSSFDWDLIGLTTKESSLDCLLQSITFAVKLLPLLCKTSNPHSLSQFLSFFTSEFWIRGVHGSLNFRPLWGWYPVLAVPTGRLAPDSLL